MLLAIGFLFPEESAGIALLDNELILVLPLTQLFSMTGCMLIQRFHKGSLNLSTIIALYILSGILYYFFLLFLGYFVFPFLIFFIPINLFYYVKYSLYILKR